MNVNTGREPLATIKGFNGLYVRGSYDTVPLNHLSDCLNCIFPGADQVSIREPVTASSSIANRNIIDYFVSEVFNDSRLLTLDIDGNLRDELRNVILATMPEATGIVALNIYGRTYLSFTKDNLAYPGGSTYYYDGYVFRKIAGQPPLKTNPPVLTLQGTLPSGGSTSKTVILNLIESDPIDQQPNGTFIGIYSWTNDPVVGTGIEVGNSIILAGYSGAAASMNGTWVISEIIPGGGAKTLLKFSVSPALVSTTVYSVEPATGTVNLVIPNSPQPGLTVSVDPGVHGIAYCYEYKNGYLSPPSPIVYIDDPSGFPILVSNILPAPVDNVVARIILMTRANQNELFFVPNGRIAGNSALDSTFLINNVLDTSLIVSADYLNDIMSEVPSCSAMRFYKGRMVLIGQDKFPDDILISDQLIVESFNGVTGIVHVPPEIGNNPSNTGLVIRDILYILKPNGTYSTQDNGNDPGTWSVTLIDSGLGAFEGNCSVFSSSFSSQDVMDLSFIINLKGVLIFNGTYLDPSLTVKIRTLWDMLPPQGIRNIRVCHDINLKRIYISLPLYPPVSVGAQFTPAGDLRCHVILMGDYNEGLDANNIKWSVWTSRFFDSILRMSMEVFNLEQVGLKKYPVYQLSLCNSSDTIYKIVSFVHGQTTTPVYFGDVDSNGQQFPIKQYIITGEVGIEGINVFTMINLSINGYGICRMLIFAKDRIFSKEFGNLALFPNKTLEYQKLINVENESIQVCLIADQSVSGPDTGSARQGFFQVRKISVYGKKKYNMRPNYITP